MMANVNEVMQLTTSANRRISDRSLWDTTKYAAEEDKELAWGRLSVLFGTPVGNMRYTVLAYFYIDCQSKVRLNVAICISAYYSKKTLLKGAQIWHVSNWITRTPVAYLSPKHEPYLR